VPSLVSERDAANQKNAEQLVGLDTLGVENRRLKKDLDTGMATRDKKLAETTQALNDSLATLAAIDKFTEEANAAQAKADALRAEAAKLSNQSKVKVADIKSRLGLK
jgi:septal ring factor EnvC (AmiA/AmiB activator)